MTDNDYAYNPSASILATELNRADGAVSGDPVQKKGDEEKSPKFITLASGAEVGRVLVAGALTDVRDVGDGQEYLQARVVTADGETAIAYAGQYDPDVKAALKAMEAPTFVAVIGKPRSYEDIDEDTGESTFYTSIRPDMVQEIDEQTRDSINADAASGALERLGGAAESDAEGAVKEAALAAARDVAGIFDEEEAESDTTEADDTEADSAGGSLDPVDIAQAVGCQPHRAESIAEHYDDPAEIVADAEAGDLMETPDVGDGTQAKVVANAESVQDIAEAVPA
jgi:RPA family protein